MPDMMYIDYMNIKHSSFSNLSNGNWITLFKYIEAHKKNIAISENPCLLLGLS